MELFLFFKGLILGISIAAPVGPIGILCIRRTLDEGRMAGFITGLGAASADAIYATVAAFGLTFVSNFLINQQNTLRLIGGIYLFILGIKLILVRPLDPRVNVHPKENQVNNYFSTFFLTLTNPLTIISFIAIFSSVGFLGSEIVVSPILLISGVFSGSVIWWVFLTMLVGAVRYEIDLPLLIWINRGSGLIILGFGLFAFLSILNKI